MESTLLAVRQLVDSLLCVQTSLDTKALQLTISDLLADGVAVLQKSLYRYYSSQ